ncbi:nuclear protein 1 [Alligator mississippiensis]|uniref:Nuclear protein 1 n=1 Tax=Alligator mississippiensis TaxID=8496 RepID=A0A151PE55_ALLMI|nr:nuclear protein 1 [Alligator mississippiensis]XP_019350988.1 nuclear protein 1 [Alligator mississippiensis]KYO47308.1 nuclear protein 1 [Alligator mississippiensis]
MASARLDAARLVPTPFEGRYLDACDYYSLTERYAVPDGRGRKGRTKREAAAHTNRPSPAGHERKLATKLQRSERRRAGKE